MQPRQQHAHHSRARAPTQGNAACGGILARSSRAGGYRTRPGSGATRPRRQPFYGTHVNSAQCHLGVAEPRPRRALSPPRHTLPDALPGCAAVRWRPASARDALRALAAGAGARLSRRCDRVNKISPFFFARTCAKVVACGFCILGMGSFAREDELKASPDFCVPSIQPYCIPSEKAAIFGIFDAAQEESTESARIGQDRLEVARRPSSSVIKTLSGTISSN